MTDMVPVTQPELGFGPIGRRVAAMLSQAHVPSIHPPAVEAIKNFLQGRSQADST
jgi:hypothetical protein